MEDIVGNKYGLITVVKFVKREKHPKHNCSRYFYIGKCECGVEKELFFYNSAGVRISAISMYAPKDKFEVPDGLYYQSHKYSAKIGNFIRTVAKLEAK